jgi:sarcosine oxidase gamma subunit
MYLKKFLTADLSFFAFPVGQTNIGSYFNSNANIVKDEQLKEE